VYLLSYDDFAIVYELRVWLEEPEEVSHYRNEIYSLIWYHFRRHNIEIPYPVRQVNMHTYTKYRRRTHAITAQKILAILKKVPILQPLSPPELETIARQATACTYAAQE